MDKPNDLRGVCNAVVDLDKGQIEILKQIASLSNKIEGLDGRMDGHGTKLTTMKVNYDALFLPGNMIPRIEDNLKELNKTSRDLDKKLAYYAGAIGIVLLLVQHFWK